MATTTNGPIDNSLTELKAERKGLFLRSSTGLVRELRPFDALNLVLVGIGLPIMLVQTLGFIPIFWPHANIALAFLLSAPLSVCFALTYLYFTALIPRSGGDYVWVSRTLGPTLGFMVNFSLSFAYVTWLAFSATLNFKYIVPPFAYVVGIHWSVLANPSNNDLFIMGTVMIVATAVLMVFSVRVSAWFMAICFVTIYVGMAMWAIAMAVGSHAGFVARWNATSGADTVNSIIHQAQQQGFDVSGGIVWGATLLAIFYMMTCYLGVQFPGYVAGEIKDIRRAANLSIIGGIVLTVITISGLLWLVYRYYGFEFYGSLAYMGLGEGSANSNLPTSPWLPMLMKFLPGPHIMGVFIAFCFVVNLVWWMPAGFLAVTRNVFAWSFDGLAPAWMTNISERFHTPVLATVVVAAVTEFVTYLIVYQGLGAYLMNMIVLMGAAFAVVSIAAALTPYRRPSIHADARGWAAKKWGSVPVITIVGAISAITWAAVVVIGLKTGTGGVVGLKPMLEAAAIPVVALVWYWIAKFYRRSKGTDLSLVFNEIPPE